MHVHVYCGDGEAKFWLEPHIEQIIEVHDDELKRAWHKHFPD